MSANGKDHDDEDSDATPTRYIRHPSEVAINLADLTLQFEALASRFSEAARAIDGMDDSERKVYLADAGRRCRRLGDELHEVARVLEGST